MRRDAPSDRVGADLGPCFVDRCAECNRRTIKQAVKAFATSVVIVIGVVGCAPVSPSPTVRTPLNLSLPIHPNAVTLDALLRGELHAEAGCLFLRGAEGRLIGVAWPARTTWNPDRRAITVGGVEATLGEFVRLRGGLVEVSVENVDGMAWIEPPRPECLGDLFFFAGGLSRE